MNMQPAASKTSQLFNYENGPGWFFRAFFYFPATVISCKRIMVYPLLEAGKCKCSSVHVCRKMNTMNTYEHLVLSVKYLITSYLQNLPQKEKPKIRQKSVHLVNAK